MELKQSGSLTKKVLDLIIQNKKRFLAYTSRKWQKPYLNLESNLGCSNTGYQLEILRRHGRNNPNYATQLLVISQAIQVGLQSDLLRDTSPHDVLTILEYLHKKFGSRIQSRVELLNQRGTKYDLESYTKLITELICRGFIYRRDFKRKTNNRFIIKSSIGGLVYPKVFKERGEAVECFKRVAPAQFCTIILFNNQKKN